MELDRAAAARHPLFGVGGWLWVLVGGFAWCVVTSLVRLVLLVVGISSPPGEVALEDAVLTFMPVADIAFVALFGWLILRALRPGRRDVPETAAIACGLYVIYAVPYVFAFRHLTGTAAFSLAAPQTWLHYVVPVAFCLSALFYLALSRRVHVTYLRQVRRDDPWLGAAGALGAAT